MKKSVLLNFLLVAVLLGLVGSPPAALAQDKTLVWNRYDVSIAVQPDGEMQVEETQEINFTSGTFKFGFAAIPLDRVERITDVRVSELMPDGRWQEYTPNSTDPYGFTTSITEDNNLEIVWYFPPISNDTATYILRYRVSGGLRIYPEGDQVWWKAIAPDHNFPIRRSTVTISPPQTFPKDQLVVESYGAPVSHIAYTDSGAVVFTAADIAADQELEVRVQFPHGHVQAEAPAWQQSDDFYRKWEPVFTVLFGFIGLALLLGGPVLVVVLWYTRGRDAASIEAPDYISEPPGDLPAALAGTLVDERADVKDIIAAIFDLAQRGAIRMEEEQSTGFLGVTNREFVFHLQDASLARYPHEKRLLENIFGSRTERSLRDLNEKFYSAIPPLQNDLYQQVVTEGFFPANPESTRTKWRSLGVVGLIVSVLMACGLLILLGDFSGAAICPGLGLAVAMVSLLAVSGSMPRKTGPGAEEAAKWLAFKKYLQNIEDYSDLNAVKEKFQEYLPYAVAFGLEKQVISKFSAIPDAPAPTWWGPMYLPHHHGGYYGPANRPGSSGSPAGGPPGPLAGEGMGMPSLSGMSEGLGSSLAGMSAGLGSLLNSASSTLTSSPPPPPSSDGGFSGGGFSGGGGFGGGGGGGGSRGFG